MLVEDFDGDLELWVFLVNALVYFAEGTLAQDGLINVIGLLQLVHTGHHMDGGRLFRRLDRNVVLFVAPLDQ